MTKKDHIKIAKILKMAWQSSIAYDYPSASETVDNITAELGLYLKQDNPNFDSEKFNKAIYGEEKN